MLAQSVPDIKMRSTHSSIFIRNTRKCPSALSLPAPVIYATISDRVLKEKAACHSIVARAMAMVRLFVALAAALVSSEAANLRGDSDNINIDITQDVSQAMLGPG